MRTFLLAAALFSLAACGDASATKPAAAAAPAAKPAGPVVGKPNAEGKVLVKATEEGFEPAKIEAPAGKPLTLVFRRDVERTCMTGVVFPELAIEKELPLGTDVVVEVTPKAGGTITFQCPMGMGKSAIVSL